MNPTGSPQKFLDYRESKPAYGGTSTRGGLGSDPDGYVDPVKTSDRIKALFDGLHNDEALPSLKKVRKRGRKMKRGKKVSETAAEDSEAETTGVDKVDEELANKLGKTVLKNEGPVIGRDSHGGYFTAPEGYEDENDTPQVFAEEKAKETGQGEFDVEEERGEKDEEEEDQEEEEEEEGEEEEEEDESIVPGMNIRLLPHQIRGLRFLSIREEGKNRGGLLCDDVSQSSLYPLTHCVNLTCRWALGKLSRLFP